MTTVTLWLLISIAQTAGSSAFKIDEYLSAEQCEITAAKIRATGEAKGSIFSARKGPVPRLFCIESQVARP